MPAIMEKQELAAEIIDRIREGVLEMIEENPDADSWDEEEEGAGWMDNELAWPTEYLREVFPAADIPDWSDSTFNSVEEYRMGLENTDLMCLRFIHYFIENGGTSNAEFAPRRLNGQGVSTLYRWLGCRQ